MRQNVLVVGGAGYIGSHTCKSLSRHGFTPVAYDNLSFGHRDFVKWGPLIVGDASDVQAIARTVRDYQVVAVIHFGAFAYVRESMIEPAKYYRNNVGGTVGLLDGMRTAGCDKLIFSSTCAVYGGPERLQIAEDTPTNPVNPYGRSKLMCEEIINDYRRAYGLSAVALRYFNASGDDEDGEVGELREIETHLIPRAMMALQGYINDFQVFGSNFPTPDGTAIRDYIHVADLAEAHVLALRRLLASDAGGIFNLGGGKGYSVGEVLREIARVTGRSLPAPRVDRQPGDPAQLVADVSLARRELGFEPKRSDLPTIVKTAWNWHLRAHPLRNSAPQEVGAVTPFAG